MPIHEAPIALNRRATEWHWWQRRDWLRASAAWLAAQAGASAWAASGNIVELSGDVLSNGRRLHPNDTLALGDEVRTGPNAGLVAVVGGAALRVRANSHVVLGSAAVVDGVQPQDRVLNLLRILTGAVVAVWRPGAARQVRTPTVTLGIRGTGTYVEVFPERANRSYFCNCYGTVDVGSGAESVLSQSQYHQSFWVEPEPVDGRLIHPAKAINHTDEELEFLAPLVGQRTAWQIAGRKGVKDGRGYLDLPDNPTHPAARPTPRAAAPNTPGNVETFRAPRGR